MIEQGVEQGDDVHFFENFIFKIFEEHAAHSSKNSQSIREPPYWVFSEKWLWGFNVDDDVLDIVIMGSGLSSNYAVTVAYISFRIFVDSSTP